MSKRELLAAVEALKSAMEFPTQDALEKYLKDHPGADKNNHSVEDSGGTKKNPSRKEKAKHLVQVTPGTGVSTPGRSKKLLEKVKEKFPDADFKIDSQGFMRGTVPKGELAQVKKYLKDELKWDLLDDGPELYPGRKGPKKTLVPRTANELLASVDEFRVAVKGKDTLEKAPTLEKFMQGAIKAMRSGTTGYAIGPYEPRSLEALADDLRRFNVPVRVSSAGDGLVLEFSFRS